MPQVPSPEKGVGDPKEHKSALETVKAELLRMKDKQSGKKQVERVVKIFFAVAAAVLAISFVWASWRSAESGPSRLNDDQPVRVVERCISCGAPVEFGYHSAGGRGSYCKKCTKEILDVQEAIQRARFLEERGR
jgi:hypothetical protein